MQLAERLPGYGRVSQMARISRRRAATVAILASIATAGAIGGPPAYRAVTGSSPTPGGANLWIDTTGGTCTRSSSLVAYSDPAACASMQAAMAACTAGDTVRMKNGTYGAQTVTQALSTPGCTIIGESLAGVVTGQLNVSGSFITIDTATVDVGATHAAGAAMGGSNNTWRNVAIHGQFASIDWGGATNTWDGGELGCSGCTAGQRDFCAGDAEPLVIQGATTGVRIKRITFWPMATVANASCNHLETIRIDGTCNGVSCLDNIVLERNIFKGGSADNTARVFITRPSTSPSSNPTNITLKNNFFGGQATANDTDVHANVTSCATFVYAYNTFFGGDHAIQCATTAGMQWIGNTGPKAGSGCFGTYVKNVWQSLVNHSCGTDAWITGADYQHDQLGIDATGHLFNTSAARNGAETSYCLSTLGAIDIDGGTRPDGPICDAGSDEYGVP